MGGRSCARPEAEILPYFKPCYSIDTQPGVRRDDPLGPPKPHAGAPRERADERPADTLRERRSPARPPIPLPTRAESQSFVPPPIAVPLTDGDRSTRDDDHSPGLPDPPERHSVTLVTFTPGLGKTWKIRPSQYVCRGTLRGPGGASGGRPSAAPTASGPRCAPAGPPAARRTWSPGRPARRGRRRAPPGPAGPRGRGRRSPSP